MELWCRGDEDSLTSKLVGCPHHLSTTPYKACGGQSLPVTKIAIA